MTAGQEVNNAENGDQQDAVEVPEIPLDTNIAHYCVMKDDVGRFVKCFEDEEDPFYSKVADMLYERDHSGKTPLDLAVILGRISMIKELVTRGVDVNYMSSTGYTALHHAANWGKIESLKVLVDIGADLQLKTIRQEERARELAERYKKTECVDFLDWAEARQHLLDAIAQVKDMLADPEKHQGRLAKDEKNRTVNACNEKSDWIENTPGATTQDFLTQKLEFDETLAPIWAKLSEPPPEKPEKK